ncbi:MAG: DUF2007 domain-containing protein [Firmicutes bacterium]|nr:DUF2007 domain-containing protein [Bacillota bacterium]
MKYNGTETWVSVFQAATEEEANMIKGILETAKIPALLDRNTSEAFDLSDGIFGEIVVRVPKKLAAKAAQLLQINQWE